MQTAGYAEILRKLQLFFNLCDTLDLRNEAEQGRFGIYEARIRHLISGIEAIQAGESEQLLFAKINPDLPFFVEALSEAFEVGRMVDFLLPFPRAVLRPMFQHVLGGPVLPSAETHNTNQARNIQFELSLGALLSRTGILVEFAEPDLRCRVADLSFFVACKRIWSPGRLNERIAGAIRQLQRELKPHPDGGGIIAISLSRVLARADGRPQHIASQAEGLQMMQSQIERFIDEYGARWEKSHEAQGILFQATSVFTNAGTGKIDVGGFIVMHGTGPIVEAVAMKLGAEAIRY
jgi:hypothetical protein